MKKNNKNLIFLKLGQKKQLNTENVTDCKLLGKVGSVMSYQDDYHIILWHVGKSFAEKDTATSNKV